MNLICFPHYTCGGLLCDIFNETFSPVLKNGGIGSIYHNVGKIGDSDSVLVNFDPDEFSKKLQRIRIDKKLWIGTHCWPGTVDISMCNQVVVITTTTFRSKLYRWMRAYHHYYKKLESWNSLSAQDKIDKERETAKNYLVAFGPVNKGNVINIEFSEVVENSVEFSHLIGQRNVDAHLQRWKSINSFLYESDIWNTVPVKRFYEAELECNLGKYYVYQ